MDQVTSVYGLINFLRRLRIIGTLYAHTEPAEKLNGRVGHYEFIDFSNADYSLVKDSYDPAKIGMNQQELLEGIFGRITLNKSKIP
jgi:hypothetical protein